MEATPETIAETCVACGRTLDSPFCPDCGEKRASDRSHSLLEFVREHVFEAMVNFDGRAFRTYTTLLARPGKLTAEFMRGVRLRYLSPLQCFLILNVAFFVWSSAVQFVIFDTPLRMHLATGLYGRRAEWMVIHRLAETNETFKEFRMRFDAVGAAQARTLVLSMVPMFAVFLGVLTIGRKKRSAVQHLVFSLHTYSFYFLLLPVVLYAVAALLRFVLAPFGWYAPNGSDDVLGMGIVLGMATYLTISLRRAYAFGWPRALVTATALAATTFFILVQYRRLLFFVTFWSM